MVFGLKGIKHSLSWMSNDDVETPTALVGKKIAPILHVPGEKAMPESLDIVRRVDEDATWGAPLLKPSSGRKDLDAWEEGVAEVLRRIQRPRYIKAYLPEFAFGRGREAYVRNHPIADPKGGEVPDRAAWQAMSPTVWHEWYAAHFANSGALLEQLNAALPQLDGLVHSEDSVSPGGVGYDDIVFFGKLRGTSLIRGIKYGPKLQKYLETMSERSEIPLYSGMAI